MSIPTPTTKKGNVRPLSIGQASKPTSTPKVDSLEANINPHNLGLGRQGVAEFGAVPVYMEFTVLAEGGTAFMPIVMTDDFGKLNPVVRSTNRYDNYLGNSDKYIDTPTSVEEDVSDGSGNTFEGV